MRSHTSGPLHCVLTRKGCYSRSVVSTTSHDSCKCVISGLKFTRGSTWSLASSFTGASRTHLPVHLGTPRCEADRDQTCARGQLSLVDANANLMDANLRAKAIHAVFPRLKARHSKPGRLTVTTIHIILNTRIPFHTCAEFDYFCYSPLGNIVVFQSNASISFLRNARHVINRSLFRTHSSCVVQFYRPSAAALAIANDGGRNKE